MVDFGFESLSLGFVICINFFAVFGCIWFLWVFRGKFSFGSFGCQCLWWRANCRNSDSSNCFSFFQRKNPLQNLSARPVDKYNLDGCSESKITSQFRKHNTKNAIV